MHSLGLADALADLVDGLRPRAGGPAVRLHTQGLEVDLPDAAALAAYHVVPEGLNNALKHARAGCIAVAVERWPDGLRLSVEDDGVGLPADWQRRGRFGRLGLSERLAALGGRCDVGPRPGGGMRVSAGLPLPVSPGVPA